MRKLIMGIVDFRERMLRGSRSFEVIDRAIADRLVMRLAARVR